MNDDLEVIGRSAWQCTECRLRLDMELSGGQPAAGISFGGPHVRFPDEDGSLCAGEIYEVLEP